MKKLAVLVVLPCALLALHCSAQDGDPSACPMWPIAVVAQSPAPDPPPLKPDPVRPIRHEYSWPAAAHQETTASAFLIVLADSTVRLAIAVWQQDGSLHFLASSGASGVIRLDAINREATRRLNAERGLTLQLPAANPQHQP